MSPTAHTPPATRGEKKRAKAVRSSYDTLASAYDTRWKNYLLSTHRVALALLRPGPGERILDASGGTGLLAEKLMRRVGPKGTVILTDTSEGMLSVARKRLKGHTNARVVRNDVHKLRFGDRRFSKAVSCSAMHHYARPENVIAEFRRVLKPYGTLVIIDWCRDSPQFKLFDALLRVFKSPNAGMLTSKEMTRMLTKGGFDVRKTMKWSHGLWSLMGIRAVKR